MSQNHELFSASLLWYDFSLSWMPSFTGILAELCIFIALIYLYRSHKNSSVAVLFDSLFEKVYDFFTEILWDEEENWVKSYIVWIFFLILFSNFMWVIIEFIAPVFWKNAEGHYLLEDYISIPTADLNFNIAMAVISVLLILYTQFKHLWLWKFAYEYFPVLWKGYLTYELWHKPAVIDYPIFTLVKLFDIVISVFLWILEIIWTIAKVISLSFRLFGNMTSWAILLWMLMTGLWAFTVWATGFIWGYEFPVLFPLIVYAQEILVALIQAIVFPLLVAIFIKVAKAH